MIKISPKIKMGGVNYHIEVIDKNTGVIKQVTDSHNVFLNQWWSLWNQTGSSYDCYPSHLAYGSGSGEPSSSDTSMFTLIGYIKMESSSYVLSENKKTATLTLIYRLGNSGDPITISELGLAGTGAVSARVLITHSVVDPSITQTSNDVVVVTATYIITLTDSDNFRWYGLDTRNLIGLCDPNLSYRNRVTQLQRAGLGVNQRTSTYPLAGVIDTHAESFASGVFNYPEMNYTSRLEATEGNTHYYNSIVTYYGYIPLPNAEIFPYYTINDINIGTGDGVTTDFNNPLNYFIENSDVVYKNGVALTRGTDYTIDYRNNKDMLCELTPCAEEGTTYAGYQQTLAATEYYPLFVANNKYSIISLDTATDINRLRTLAEIPLFLKENTPFLINFTGNKLINTLHVGNLSNVLPSGGGQDIQIILEYATEEDHTNWITIIPLSTAFNSYTGMTFTFANTLAKHWRLSITSRYGSLFMHSNSYGILKDCFLGYVGDPYIKFTTAPADGDVLTMSVQMDRPFKNGNYAMDLRMYVVYY